MVNGRELAQACGRRLDAFNAAHPWSHNDHFHGWILSRVPAHARTALDVGCGHGALVEELARRGLSVTGIDPDAAMAAGARERSADRPGASVEQMAFADVTGSYDVITMVATLHHLHVDDTLEYARDLLNPGGRLLVVGLAKPATRHDFAYDLVSAVANPIRGLIVHPRRADGPRPVDPFPARDPELTFDEVRDVVARLLPRAHMRRRLYFRYTLEWTKPA